MLKLIEELKETSARLASVVQAQLMKEDVKRLERVVQLADASDEFAEFEKEALYLGWTQGDFRTPELHDSLKPFLSAAYQSVQECGPESDALVRSRWIEFNRDRASKLVGCL